MREAPQYQWLRASSLAQDRIYIERVVGGYPAMELMLKDCRDGDVVAVWAPDVFGPEPTGSLMKSMQRARP